MRPYELATAAAIVFVAAVAMIDSFKTSGWTPAGPDAGWYPFWSAAAMGLAAAVVLGRSLRGATQGRFFSSSEGTLAFVRLVLPMFVAVGVLRWLGFYIVSGLYMGYFGRWIGRFHWLAVAALALGVPVAIYLGFELGFRVPLPKSIFYDYGLYF